MTPTAPIAPTTPTTRARAQDPARRAIGRGAATIALGYLGLTVGRSVLVVVFAQQDAGEFLRPDAAGRVGSQVIGALAVLAFVVIAGGLAAVEVGLADLDGPEPSLAARLRHTAVVVGCCGLVLTGAIGRVVLSPSAGALADTGADPAAQVAALHVTNLVALAGLTMGGLGLAAALVGVATWGVRASLVGRPVAVVSAAGAAVITVGFLGFAFAPIQLVAPLVFGAVAVAVRRGRTTAGH